MTLSCIMWYSQSIHPHPLQSKSAIHSWKRISNGLLTKVAHAVITVLFLYTCVLYRATKISWLLLWCSSSKGHICRWLWSAPTTSSWVLPGIPGSTIQLLHIWDRIHLSTGYIKPICWSAIRASLWSLNCNKYY